MRVSARVFTCVVAFLCAGWGSCWTGAPDQFSGANGHTDVSTLVFEDTNANGRFDQGEAAAPNEPVTFYVHRFNGTTPAFYDYVRTQSDSTGRAFYRFDSATSGTFLYQVTLEVERTARMSTPVFRQLSANTPDRSANQTKERYCVAYEDTRAMKEVFERFDKADMTGLSAWRQLAYKLAATDMVAAATQAQLQRRLGNASIEFFPGVNPRFLPGDPVPPSTLRSCAGVQCPAGQTCHKNTGDDFFACRELSPCVRAPKQQAVLLGVSVGGSGGSLNATCAGPNQGRFEFGLKGQAPRDEENMNAWRHIQNPTASELADKAFVFADRLNTYHFSGKPRTPADFIEDLGRQLGNSGAHEVGHTTGLVSAVTLRGSTRPAELQTVDGLLSVNQGGHPDPLDTVTARLRIDPRPVMLSGAAPWVLGPERFADLEPARCGANLCTCGYSPMRVPARFSAVETDYMHFVTPNP